MSCWYKDEMCATAGFSCCKDLICFICFVPLEQKTKQTIFMRWMSIWKPAGFCFTSGVSTIQESVSVGATEVEIAAALFALGAQVLHWASANISQGMSIHLKWLPWKAKGQSNYTPRSSSHRWYATAERNKSTLSQMLHNSVRGCPHISNREASCELFLALHWSYCISTQYSLLFAGCLRRQNKFLLKCLSFPHQPGTIKTLTAIANCKCVPVIHISTMMCEIQKPKRLCIVP